MKDVLRRWGGVRSLRERLVILLSIGILPLGVVAVVQTTAVVEDARELAERDVLRRTVEAASAEEAVLRKSFGAASALGTSALVTGPNSDACTQIMKNFVEQFSPYIFAGFISNDGVMRCTSTGETVDLSRMESWADFVADPRPMAAVNTEGAATGQSVIITTVPVFDPDSRELVGAASISLPHRVLDQLFERSDQQLGLALLDTNGTVLSASTGVDDANQFERLGIDPAALDVSSSGVIFSYNDAKGDERLAALVPLLEDRVFVLGLWEPSVQRLSVPFLGTPAPLFPILMWAVALALAILAIDRLILRHLKEIDDKMSGFSLDDPRDSYAILDEPPSELRSIAVTYNRMVERILHDAALLEDTVREKELLLREVHHRVKNNLQLISSILNMQMRAVPEGQGKRVLGRVQDRVMSLSSIHKALYSGANVDNVRVDTLLSEVIGAAFSLGLPAGSGVVTDKELAPVYLDADQAVPVALLANELVTNAVKYVGRPETSAPAIRVRLSEEDNEICLLVENTLGTPLRNDLQDESTGLGGRLIDAFVTQLGATIDQTEENGTYRVSVRFRSLLLQTETPSVREQVAKEVANLKRAVQA